MDSNFRVFWLSPVTWNILGYSLFCEQREKWRVILRKFQKKKLKKRFFIHQALAVQTMDSAIHWINHYPLDNSIGFACVYSVDSDLSGG